MNLWSTFLDLDTLHESASDKRWTDQALDELKNKPKSDWTEDDWNTYHYCKNANAERDYFDSLDEDFYDFSPASTSSWVKMPPANNQTQVSQQAKQASVYVVSTRKAADLQQPDFCEFEQGDVWHGVVEYADKLTSGTGHFDSLYDAVAAAKKNNQHFDLYIYEYDASANKLTLVGKVDKVAGQPATPSTNTPARTNTSINMHIVSIVEDRGKLRALAVNGDGLGNPVAWVQFPNALRTKEGQLYVVDQLIWNGKNYRVTGSIRPISTNLTTSVSNTQNINEKINREITEMNFNSIFEELNKLYEEEKKVEKPEQVEGEVKEEPVEEGCAKEALTEAADEEVEMVDDEVVEEEPVEDTEQVDDAETVADFIKSVGDYEGELVLEFKPIVIDGKEYAVKGIAWDDTEEGKLVAEVVFDMPEAEEEPVEEEVPVEEVPVDEE